MKKIWLGVLLIGFANLPIYGSQKAPPLPGTAGSRMPKKHTRTRVPIDSKEALAEAADARATAPHQPLAILIAQALDTENPTQPTARSVTMTFGEMISQKAAPILVSPTIVYNLFYRAVHPPQALTSAEKASHVKEREWIKWPSVTENDWEIWLIDNADLFLFIPKRGTHKAAFNLAGAQQFTWANSAEHIMRRAALRLDAAKAAARPGAETRIAFKASAVDTLLVRNVAGKADQELVWDIYLDGHGNKGLIADLAVSKFNQFLELINRPALPPSSEQQGYVKKNWKKPLHVGVLMIHSCYIGGENFDWVRYRKDMSDTIVPQNVPCIIILCGLDETVAFHGTIISGSDESLVGQYSYADIFKAAAAVTTEQKSDGLSKLVHELLLGTSTRRGPFEKSTIHAIENIPRILLPDGRDLDAQYVDGIINLNNVLARVHALEEKPINLCPHVASKRGREIAAKKQPTIVLVHPLDIQAHLEVCGGPVEEALNIKTMEELKFSRWKELPVFAEIASSQQGLLNEAKGSAPQFPAIHTLLKPGLFDELSKWTKTCLFPVFISMGRGGSGFRESMHHFASIMVRQTAASGKIAGVINFIRDAFCDARSRFARRIFLIDELRGFNDLSLLLEIIRLRYHDQSVGELEQALTPFIDKEIVLKNCLIETEGMETGAIGTVGTKELEITISFNFADSLWTFYQKFPEPGTAMPRDYRPWNFKKVGASEAKKVIAAEIAEATELLESGEAKTSIPLKEDILQGFGLYDLVTEDRSKVYLGSEGRI